jgi:hypothetical protein
VAAGEPVLVVNVFAGIPDYSRLSPFARELHARWGDAPDPVAARRAEDEAVLVGRRPRRVDVLHERFFRFDGVNRDLYGWTGWSPEAQTNVFLTLAEPARNKTPFYRWVARLISLPEEAPDIADPEVREGLRSIIGDVESYPYVVMEQAVTAHRGKSIAIFCHLW